MTLHRKSLLILASTSVLSFLIFYATASRILFRGFTGIEDQIACQRMAQARAALDKGINDVDVILSDWAAWDDSWDFVQSRSETYIRSTLLVTSLVNIGVSTIAYFDVNGREVFTRQVDIDTAEERPFSPSLRKHLAGSDLLKHSDSNSTRSGVLMLDEGPMLIASRPIIKSDKSGPIRGTLVMGRYLDRTRIKTIQRVLLVEPIIRPVHATDLPASFRTALANLGLGGAPVVQRPNEESLSCYDLVPDIWGEPAIMIRIDLPRDVNREARLMVRFLMLCLFGSAALTGVCVLRLLDRHVLKRVASLSSAAHNIATSKNLSLRVPLAGKDELGGLAGSFNEMLTALQAAEQDLCRARDGAEQANRMKSRFLANVSHEIRTPLNCMIGFSEAILANHSVPAIHEQARTILRESEILLALINDLLDQAKIEAGRMELEARPFELRPLLDQLVTTAREQARQKPVAIRLELGAGVPETLQGDSLRLWQVLINLVSNAIKFTREGSVTIRAQREAAAADMLRFTVLDTGIGIPKDRQEAIFGSFVQVDCGTTRKYGGTGLGTTIARQLVELMGGQIGLVSEPGKGSAFWFTMPCVLRAAGTPSAPVAGSPESVPAQPAPTDIKGNILLVEDYPSNREVISLHLQSAGHTVTLAENGLQAVAACEDTHFDLILMDLHMPEMDGCEAAQIIRSGGPCARVPIVGLTASAEGSALEACRRAGMNDMLGKPVRRGALLAAVARHLATAGDAATAAAEPNADEPPAECGSAIPWDYAGACREFGDAAMARRVATQFLQNVSAQLQKMRTALSSGEQEVLRQESHAIKGGAATLLAEPLAASARILEERARQTQAANLGDALDRLAADFESLKAYVQEQLGEDHGRCDA